MPMIYSLVGTSASGKTTLFDRLCAEGIPDCAFVPESARKFYQMNSVPQEQRSSLQNQLRIQRCFIDDLQGYLDAGTQTVLSDSSVLSCIAFIMLNGNAETTQMFIDSSLPYLQSVTLFFLLNPHEIDYQRDPADAIRTESVSDRLFIHDNFLHVLQFLNLPYREITGTIDERIEAVKNALSGTYA